MSVTPRRSRPRLDLRLVLGVALVLVSIVGVWLLVSSARATAPALVATRTLLPGEELREGDLRSVDVLLADAGDRYLSRPPSAGTVVRTVEAGELVPRGAVARENPARTSRVVVRLATSVSTEVRVGSAVDVWVTENRERGVLAEPRLLAEGARVARVTAESGMMSRGGASIELAVPRDRLPGVLAAVAADAAISLVPGVEPDPYRAAEGGRP